ncbi:MAG: hypothetical protein HEP71_00415 [Roseivirga sp.]|nr:hypothetical protein [Roseivirga sp.]
MRIFFTFILSLTAIGHLNAHQNRLQLNLEEGKVYKQAMISSSTIEQEYMGEKVDIQMTLSGVTSYMVKQVHNSYYDIEMQYDRLSMIMGLPTGEMSFDSESDDENDIFSEIMSLMIGKSVEIKMARTGKILEVKNVEVLFDSILDNFPMLTEEQIQPIKDQLADAYGADAFKGNIEMVTAIFPDTPVAIGESWSIDTELKSGFRAEMNTVYTFKQKNADHILITGSSAIKTINLADFVEVNGNPTKYNLTGTMVSTLKIDKNTGWILEAKIDQNLNGDVSIKPLGSPEAMTIPMIMKNKMTITND